ncbi:MAG: hypothetical protein AAF907_18200, partial [Planctomycetota bacterium]
GTAVAAEPAAQRIAGPRGLDLSGRTAPAPEPYDAPLSGSTVRGVLEEGPIRSVQFRDNDFLRDRALPSDRFLDRYDPAPVVADEETDPRDLKKIAGIEPFADYTPGGDPCESLCPRPDDCPEEEGLTPSCPDEVSLGYEPFQPRDFARREYMWVASNLHSNPLYFEDYVLERHGHTYGDIAQPFVSAGLFSLQLIGLPYQMGLDGPLTPTYAAGAVRPGDPVPKRTPQIPLNAKAAAYQAGAVAGFGLVLP